MDNLIKIAQDSMWVKPDVPSFGIGVERIFPLYSPHIDHIEVNKVGVVRRARIYYLRGLTGKKARIKEKKRVFSK